MMDRMTNALQQALQEAQSKAVEQSNQFIEPLHILNALIEPQGNLLRLAGVDVNTLRQKVAEKLKTLPQVSGAAAGDVKISNKTAQVLNLMDKQSKEMGDSYIASELFFLALLEIADIAASFSSFA